MAKTITTAPTTTRRGNLGVEGPTDDPGIANLRERQKRNFIATMLVSQGVPMLCGGDEISRTQGGNNNAYCQDDEISWYDWTPNDEKNEIARVHGRPRRIS